MLHIDVMDKLSKWEDYLNLVEFIYNNGQQALLGTSPVKVLYGRKCRTPMIWNNPINIIVLGKELLKEMEEEIAKMRQKLKAA